MVGVVAMSARRVPPPPVAQPLRSTSPSQAAELRRCALRVAFQRSPAHASLHARGPAARLGSVCHSVLEGIGKGALDGVLEDQLRARILELWDAAVAEQQADAEQSQVDRDLGPAQRWRGYFLKRARLLIAAQELARSRSVHALHLAVGLAAALSEHSMLGFGGRLRGQADRVVHDTHGLVIEDFKSGAVFESVDESEQPQIKDGYRVQLLIYAALYHEETGNWPDRGRIIGLDGRIAEIEIAPQEALAAARDTLELLDAYNRGVTATTLYTLAAASPAACSTCGFRGACDAYWTSASPAWEPVERPSSMGRVLGIHGHGDGTVSLTIAASGGTVRSGEVRIRGLRPDQISALGEDVAPGPTVRLVKLRRREQQNGVPELWAGPETEVWLL